jgi:hypothetical protein
MCRHFVNPSSENLFLKVYSSAEAVAALPEVRDLHRARIRQQVVDNFSQERMIDYYNQCL